MTSGLYRHVNHIYFLFHLIELFFYPFSGQPAKQVVHLLNEEDIPFSFSFRESSCHTDGYASSLSVEPMAGTVPPKSRYHRVLVDFFSCVDRRRRMHQLHQQLNTIKEAPA